MEFKGLLIGYRNKRVPAKAQRRKEEREGRDEGTLVGEPQAAIIVEARNAASRNSPPLFFASLRLCGKLLLILSLAVAATAQSRRPMSPMAPADILRIASVADAQIAPNGEWVAYTVSTIQGEETRSTLWLVRAGGDQPRPPTANPSSQSPDRRDFRSNSTPLLASTWNASNPRWSPDSKSIAFLANHEGQNGIWIVTLDNRQPRFIAPVQETNFFITYAGESIAWSPDSKQIAYISASEDQPEGSGPEGKGDDPRVIDRIQYKSRTSFSDRLRTHVWITTVENPEPRQLTSGLFYDHALTFSPNGNEIAFVSNHEPDPDATNNSDIFAVDLHGQVRQITNTKGCEYEPAWSPDGKWIAYTATKRDVTTIDSVAEDRHLWVISAGGGTGRELTAQLDRRISSPRWDRDSIVFIVSNNGQSEVYVLLPREPGSESVYGILIGYEAASDPVGSPNRGPFQVSGFSLSAGRRKVIAFTRSDPREGTEVWIGGPTDAWAVFMPGGMSLAPSLQFRLTGHNRFVDGFAIVRPEEIKYRSFDGTPIQGWLMKPVGWREDRKYPLILSIHGGPHGMYGWAFNPTFQVYAARGYAVLYLNPRGSSGYGQKFSDGTLNEWGGGDYKDLMAGVDEVLKRYSWIDADRLGVTGGSYGGFMTNWIITQTPRFKAAVSAASVSNLISFYSTSLYQDLIHAEFGGFPWDNYDLLWQWSPLRYVKQAQTPTLFIHGEQDNDVHITQAEEMYMALKRRGVETVLVRYPREGHGLREPRHRVDALERTLAWFDRFLK